tara:strand:+ start:6686 stop:7453 length:768 start_codon:yes stop_codon:yes gene_type:complete
MDYEYWSNYLFQAQRKVMAVEPITDNEKELSVNDGYKIQNLLLDYKCNDGEKIIGAKAGLTSLAKQKAMGVNEPVYGIITDKMKLEPDKKVALDNFIHPRIEPEIVFILGKDLSGHNLSIEEILDATESICCGLEIIDSRYLDFRFTLADVVADNTSASAFILGNPIPLDGLKLDLLGCLLEINNEVVATATGAAVLGHPAHAVSLLASWLHKQGKSLKKGWVILSGGLTNAFPIEPNNYIRGSFAHLGSVSIKI